MPPLTDNEYVHICFAFIVFAHRKTSNRTLAYQDKLPKLPNTSLEDTYNLEALQDEKKLRPRRCHCSEALAASGDGWVHASGILEGDAKDKARFALLSHMSRLFSDCGLSYGGILV
jgi:hypothetical protein